MTPFETGILASYFFVLAILAVYGWHRYYLVYLYMRHRDNVPRPLPPLDPLPVVTIQLPIYNETSSTARRGRPPDPHRRERPRDPGPDDRTGLISRPLSVACVVDGRSFDIKYLHRTDRTGYRRRKFMPG